MPAGWSVWRRMTFAREGHGARRAIERACGVLGQLDGAAARDLTGTYPIAHVVGQVDGCNAWTRLPHPVSIGRARTGAAPITVHGVEIAPTIRVSRNEPRRWLTRRSSGGVLDPNRGGAIFQYNNTDATSPPEHERSEQRACHPQSTVAICFGMRRTDMVPLVCCRELKMPHSHMPSLSATPAAPSWRRRFAWLSIDPSITQGTDPDAIRTSVIDNRARLQFPVSESQHAPQPQRSGRAVDHQPPRTSKRAQALRSPYVRCRIREVQAAFQPGSSCPHQISHP